MATRVIQKHPRTIGKVSEQYERNDAVLCPVTVALRNSPHFAMTYMRCEFREGLAILHGEVSRFYLKQIAQEIAKKVEGVELVVNKINVI